MAEQWCSLPHRYQNPCKTSSSWLDNRHCTSTSWGEKSFDQVQKGANQHVTVLSWYVQGCVHTSGCHSPNFHPTPEAFSIRSIPTQSKGRYKKKKSLFDSIQLTAIPAGQADKRPARVINCYVPDAGDSQPRTPRSLSITQRLQMNSLFKYATTDCRQAGLLRGKAANAYTGVRNLR